jgi:Zn-dependent peptidase ImmA (M78 family)
MEQLAYDNNILIFTRSIPDKISGMYYSNSDYDLITVTLNKNLETFAEKTCTLAEELEHYFLTPIDLMRAPRRLQDRYERQAKFAACRRLVPLEKLIKAKQRGLLNRYDLAEYLNVTEEFLEQALRFYQEYYGYEVYYKGSIIYLNPLAVEIL